MAVVLMASKKKPWRPASSSLRLAADFQFWWFGEIAFEESAVNPRELIYDLQQRPLCDFVFLHMSVRLTLAERVFIFSLKFV
jgi:hypothetical protein